MKQLFDNFHRRLSYLRISVTDRCNLRCTYCTPLTPETMLPHDDILTYEEILRIVRAGVKFGISKVRVTGGEPLVRKGICRFLEQLHEIEGLQDISLTTNGVLLKNTVDGLKAAGVKRINISLDSLKRQNFESITGRDHFNRVWEGIQLALDKGFSPVKINVVAMKGINDHEFLDFARLTRDYPLHVRFIEYMPIGDSGIHNRQQILTPETKEIVSALGDLIPVKNDVNDGPAFRYKYKDAKGELGFISPISHHFCSQCNRLRLTANGKLRPCLLSDKEVDIKSRLRSGISDEEISGIFLEALKLKRPTHTISSSKDYKVTTSMSAIGG